MGEAVVSGALPPDPRLDGNGLLVVDLLQGPGAAAAPVQPEAPPDLGAVDLIEAQIFKKKSTLIVWINRS